jgi:hypothetical protein
VTRKRAGFIDRVHQSRRLLRKEGPRAVVDRLRQRAADKVRPPGGKPLVVSREDLARAADVARNGWRLPSPAPLRAGEPANRRTGEPANR